MQNQVQLKESIQIFLRNSKVLFGTAKPSPFEGKYSDFPKELKGSFLASLLQQCYKYKPILLKKHKLIRLKKLVTILANQAMEIPSVQGLSLSLICEHDMLLLSHIIFT